MRRRLSAFLTKRFRSRSRTHVGSERRENGETMGDSEICIESASGREESSDITFIQQASFPENIIANHNFSEGLNCWHSNQCYAYVVADGPGGTHDRTETETTGCFVVVTQRTECWQGLEQDITSRVRPGNQYSVSAIVKVRGPIRDQADVKATLRLEYEGSTPRYVFIGSASAFDEHWEKLDGSFSLEHMPERVVFYLEGPPPGVELLIHSVAILASSINWHEESSDITFSQQASLPENIIANHNFSEGLNCWHANQCYAYVVADGPGSHDRTETETMGCFVVVTQRTECWQGLEQDITSRVRPGNQYSVSAIVKIRGPIRDQADVKVTLRLEYEGSTPKYVFIGSVSASDEHWEKLDASFSLEHMPERVVFYLEGPPPGVELLIHSVGILASSINHHEEANGGVTAAAGDENIIQNPGFEDGLNNWSGRGCKILRHDSMEDGKVVPLNGKFFASATERRDSWNGIQQEITGRVQRKLAYGVTAVVRLYGNAAAAEVRATLWVQMPNGREQYIGVSKLQASDKEWVQMEGKFLLNGSPSRVMIFLEGPPSGTDLLVNTLVVKRAQKPPPSCPPNFENVLYGVNIITNSYLTDGINGWFPLGPCNMSIACGSPYVLPPMAKASLGPSEPLNGRYILVANRTQTWMGPAQVVTDRLKLNVTYQVSAWVCVGPGINGPQNINVAIGADSQYINGGQIEVSDCLWHEIAGSFRLEKQPSKVIVYVQGPSGGVDLMVGGLAIFPVDREARCKHLKNQIDKVRKRDVVLKFSGLDGSLLPVTWVKVRQIQNSFPIGSCISRSNIDNEDFIHFFLKNFNWGVFANELKWYSTEPQRGKLSYTDADELLAFCEGNGIEARGHCIFWEAYGAVQSWVQSLSKDDLTKAIENHLTDLLTRYRGKFRHYDVDNEMLHGTFYVDRLGKDIQPFMFKTAHQLDPSATLFVNDYHVEDGTDTKASPEMYIQQITGLQQQGAQVGGIGIQGHIDYPVGPIICSALDKLAVLGLPIWFTELDVSAANEYVRADDLEVMLCEAFAHPAVGGIMLWGFWELFMFRENSHLVNAEGDLNEAGKRYLALKEEWLSQANGFIDDQATRSRNLSANVLLNHDFSEGLDAWHPNSCDGHVVSGESSFVKGITARSGRNYAILSGRTEHWQGLEHDITSKISPGASYIVSVWVQICNGIEETTEVRATLRLEHSDSPASFISIGRTLATELEWRELEGSFTLPHVPKRVIFFLEGPPAGVDLLIDSVMMYSHTADNNHLLFGDNIIKNSCLKDGLSRWHPLGACTLKVSAGSPHLLPPIARDTLGKHGSLSGCYIFCTNRAETWMGPAQDIKKRLKLHMTYQVSAWVRVGSGANCPQMVNVAFDVDDRWVNGGQVFAGNNKWYEIAGSFRVEKQAQKVVVYFQGPSPGVDLMVAGFQIFPVDRQARFNHLKEQTDKIRKRDVILRFPGLHGGNLSGAHVKIHQLSNSFPFGSCINRSDLDNEDFVDFFLKNFNWSVFGNELKWYHTEQQRGKLNYTDADEMLDFCKRHGIQTRGHCIFWEVEDAIQQWVRSLNTSDLMAAVQNRLVSLLSRYRGQFRHYDVNNEMLHGCFFRDRLGIDIIAYMFKAARELDPSAKLFVNDYNVEDGCDAKSSPEMFIQQILDLQERGAPIDGIGLQAHINHPVGTIICAALDKLAILGLPIWFTELDVEAENEHVRADDLEVVLREAYAHPAVDGIVLWGFWEVFMYRDKAHLVNAEGDISEAGRRYLQLKQEWMTKVDGEIDENDEFRFRGFHGTYNIEVVTPSGTLSKTFDVKKGESPQLFYL